MERLRLGMANMTIVLSTFGPMFTPLWASSNVAMTGIGVDITNLVKSNEQLATKIDSSAASVISAMAQLYGPLFQMAQNADGLKTAMENLSPPLSRATEADFWLMSGVYFAMGLMSTFALVAVIYTMVARKLNKKCPKVLPECCPKAKGPEEVSLHDAFGSA